MKKRLLTAVLLLTLTCGYAQNKKVAVVTFYIVKQLDVTDFGSAAQVASIKLSDNPDFDLKPTLHKFHDEFFNSYSKNFPFDLIPEDQVINNESYKTYVPVGTATEGPLKGEDIKYNIPVEGYKVVLPLMGHENERNLLAIFNQCDGVMKVYIEFKLVKIGFGGMGVAKVQALTNVALFNKNGDKVFSIHEDAASKSMSPMVEGVPVMTPEKILPMCESAMDALMKALDKDLAKMVRKANAKL